jgi:hypothetical protein
MIRMVDGDADCCIHHSSTNALILIVIVIIGRTCSEYDDIT